MRIYALIFLIALSIVPVLTQTKKGTSSVKPKAATPKPASKKATPKATPKRPNAASTPTTISGEKASWDKASAIEAAHERITALVKFLEVYPRSTRRNDALEIILKLRSDIGNERLVAGDLPAAVDAFKAAVEGSPVPLADQMFNETLAKFAPNLFFRGATVEALQLQRSIERVVEGNVPQLLSIANFYLSVENGVDALRVADEIVKLRPDSAPAHQVRALGLRMQFQLDESEVAFAKAAELDPEFVAAKRGLAEAKRSAGKFDEALELYRAILAKDATNVAAKTGLILTLFDSGKRAETELEMESMLKESASNVILLAGAAYWYASNGVADKAVEYGRRAVDADPRFVWSHIAYARGLAIQDKLPEAEKALLVARRYGNFPTLDLELALVRMEAGFYREAAETLDQSFAVEGDKVSADLGLRVRKSAPNLIELTSLERRSSIFSNRSAYDLALTERLRALLEYSVMIESEKPDAEKIFSVASRFIGERDKMQPFRELYVASHFAVKGLAGDRVLELTRNVVPSVDAAVSERSAISAILADEIYNPRTASISNNQYVELPNVPKQTLSMILRGRIEEINGIAFQSKGNSNEAITRFRRSVGVLPENSSWWRSSLWRLGTALDASGKTTEALESLIKSYKAGPTDPIKYATIESAYRRANGTTDGLVEKIGENPLRSIAMVPAPTPDATAVAVPESTPKPVEVPSPQVEPTPPPTPDSTPLAGTTSTATSNSLFPPVVITIPKPASSDSKPNEPVLKPCTFTFSEDVLNLATDGKELGVIVGTETDEDISDIAVKVSSEDISVRREPIAAIKSRALFVVKSIAGKAGQYSIKFELPCSTKEVEIRVR